MVEDEDAGSERIQPRDTRGRFLKGALKDTAVVEVLPGLKRMSLESKLEPKMCREFVQRELAKSLPTVMSALLEKVNGGDLQALKVLWQMAGLDKAALPSADEISRNRRGKNSVAAMLLKRMKEREETERRVIESSGE